MPTRLVSILIALSFLGYTVVPAAWFPCCCKNRKAASACEAEKQSCCAASKQILEVNEDVNGRCCSANQESVECGVSDHAIGQKCPKCRCIEQMRVSTGLSGQSLNEDSFRLVPLNYLILYSSLIDHSASYLQGFKDSCSHASSPFQKNSTLRC
jgi:hypothetical protein